MSAELLQPSAMSDDLIMKKRAFPLCIYVLSFHCITYVMFAWLEKGGGSCLWIQHDEGANMSAHCLVAHVRPHVNCYSD